MRELDITAGVALLAIIIAGAYRAVTTPSGRKQPGAAVASDSHPAPVIEQGLFTATFIRMRMAALAAEIDRLDTDPDVFARAFRMNVARSAYEALRTDHRRLGEPAASGHQAELLDATVGAAPARASRVEELVL